MNNRKRNLGKSCQFCLSKITSNVKFCGKCGNQLEFSRSKLPRLSLLKRLSVLAESAIFKIAKLLKPHKRIGKAAFLGFLFSSLITIVLMVAFSGVTNAAMSGMQVFSDIPLNHPIYKYCEYLISLKAINSGPSGEFYPCEPISAEAWNSTFKILKERGSLAFAEEYYFKDSEPVNGEKIKSKIKSMANKAALYIDSRELDLVFEDTSRLNVYCFLNQILSFRRAN